MADAELVNILDSEVATLQEVLRTLNGRTYKPHNLDAFEREIVERFQEVGFRVDVKWYTARKGDARVEDTYMPEVEVIGRCDPLKPGEFDHDRMREEVTRLNPLGLPSADTGLIKTPERWTEGKAREIHKHGSDCGH